MTEATGGSEVFSRGDGYEEMRWRVERADSGTNMPSGIDEITE